MVVLPTGAGKTRVALGAIAQTWEATLCLVPTRVLLAQWLEGLRAVYAGPVGCLGDGQRDVCSITIATFESAYRHMSIYGNRFQLVVVDEAHHFASGQRSEILEMCTAQHRLGLTATAPKEVGDGTVLSTLIGPVLYELTIADLAGNYLADYEVLRLTLTLSAAERATYDAAMAQFKRLYRQHMRMNPWSSWADFVAAASRTHAGRETLATWRSARKLVNYTAAKAQVLGELLKRHRDDKVLLFTADNDVAYRIARQYLVMPLTCDIGRRERSDTLDAFRAGSLRALVSSRVLNEGLDVPEANVAIVVGATQGEREHVQRVGRVLRPAPGKRAIVYDMVTRDTHEVHQSEKRQRGLGT